MFEIVLGVTLLGLFMVFWTWQRWSTFRGRLAPPDIDGLLGAVEARLSLPPELRGPFLKRLRAWAEADDGRPVYMFSLMRFHEEVRPFPGSPAFEGSPEEANTLYERAVTPLVLRHRGLPVVGGRTQGGGLVASEPALDGWDRALVVGYPSRRDFLGLLADPAYGPVEPYKLMALEVVLVPVSGDLVFPDPRLLVGAALLVLFFAGCWLRAIAG